MLFFLLLDNFLQPNLFFPCIVLVDATVLNTPPHTGKPFSPATMPFIFTCVLVPLYKHNASCQLGNGHASLLWHAIWLEQPFGQKYLQLHSFVINDNQTMASWINSKDSTQFFHTPLSAQAFYQFNELKSLIDQKYNAQAKDIWKCNGKDRSTQ